MELSDALPYIVAFIFLITILIVCFVKRSREQKMEQVQKWLLWAVTVAEKELQGKTGELKLSYVYNLFTSKFPVVAAVISFETFTFLVDQALAHLKFLIDTNEQVKNYVEGE